MMAVEKAEVPTKVSSFGLPKRRGLGELGVPRSTYYRWLRQGRQHQNEHGQELATPTSGTVSSRGLRHRGSVRCPHVPTM